MSPRVRRLVLDSARFGRTPVLFTLGLAACCLVAIVALVLVVVQRGPAPTLVGLLLALLPIPLLVVLILYLDRLEPEPRALLAAIFGAGAGIAVITALLGRALHTGVITTPDLEPHAVFQALFTSLIGLGVAYAAARPAVPGRHLAIVVGWVAAVGLDALWDHSVGERGPGLQVTYVVLIAVLLAVVVTVIADRRRVIRMIFGFLLDFEDPEVITEQDVRMLANLRLRRLGRQWARLNLGIAGKQAMTRYQLAAIELAMACHRKSLGQTTEDAYARHRDDSLTLMRATAEIVRRQEQLYPPPWIAPDSPSVFVTYRPDPDPPNRWPTR
jgi:PrsW family intramembrane metalloprotease